MDPAPLRTGEGSQSIVIAEACVVIGLKPRCVAGHPTPRLAKLTSLGDIGDVCAILNDGGIITHLPDRVGGGVEIAFTIFGSLLHL